MNLFIIGNGFDSAHGYETKYCFFRKWMEERILAVHPEYEMNVDPKTGHLVIDEIPDIPDVQIDNHGEEILDEDMATELLMWLLLYNPTIGDDWSEFEASLHDLDLLAILDSCSDLIDQSAIDKEGDLNPFWQGAGYEELAGNIYFSVAKIKSLFRQWIEDVDIYSKPKLAIGKLMSNHDRYLSFNYTETLEKVYGVPAYLVNHIHGIRMSARSVIHPNEKLGFMPSFGDLVIGHGSDDARLDFHTEHIASENLLQRTIRELRKDVDQIIAKNHKFWEELKLVGITDVYTFGFSYSDVDMPYIETIVRIIEGNKDIMKHVWYLNQYDDSNGNNAVYEDKIRGCGYTGGFGRFV